MLLRHVNVMFVSSGVSAAAFCFVFSVRYNAMSQQQILCVAIFLFAPCINSIKTLYIIPIDAQQADMPPYIDCVYTDEHSKTLICNFSQTWDCSLMMVPV
jgi:hypothetical protein